MNIEEYLSHFDKFTKDPTLEAMQYIMSKFDNPHKKLKCIHVAGTNGKGSVCEMLNKCLIEAGYTVGKFISPHLITFNDGICINNIPISDKEVEEILISLASIIEEYNKTHVIPVKWFEVITSIVFIYFYKNKCDFVVLETGLGGTTDCTNIVEPLISIITKIGYDHTDILGNTLQEIAKHKAGIIKRKSETIFAYQPEIIDIIKYKCKIENNNLHIINDKDIVNYSYTQKLQKFDYKGYKNIQINLKGKVQTTNASQCLEAISILKEKGYIIPDKAIKEGLMRVIHMARMEEINSNPQIIFDGGHNESAIQNLQQNIEQYYKNQKRVYIISILKTKDYKTVIKQLLQDREAIFYFTDGIEEKPYIPSEKLKKEAEKYIDINNIHTGNLEGAILEAKEKYKDRTIFVVGSFYTYKTVINILKK